MVSLWCDPLMTNINISQFPVSVLILDLNRLNNFYVQFVLFYAVPELISLLLTNFCLTIYSKCPHPHVSKT